MYHACACRSGAGRSINVIAIVFSDEINRVPNVIAKNRFSCRYNALIARDRDRFQRLISARPINRLSVAPLIYLLLLQFNSIPG